MGSRRGRLGTQKADIPAKYFRPRFLGREGYSRAADDPGFAPKITAVTPATQTAADVGEQTVVDDTLEERIKNLMATPPRSGNAAGHLGK